MNGSQRRNVWFGPNGWSRPEKALPLEARLQKIVEQIPAREIDELWIFPPLPDREFAAEFILLSCFDGPGRRRIVTAHLEHEPVDPDETEFVWTQHLQEHGAAPEHWVSGLPDRLLGRFEETGVPRVEEIRGREERWSGTIERLVNGNGAGTAHGNGGRMPSVTGRQNVDTGPDPEVSSPTSQSHEGD